MAAEGGRRHAIAGAGCRSARICGLLEYVLDRAIFYRTRPPLLGGAALIGADGRLIGSARFMCNMLTAANCAATSTCGAIDLLSPILDDMLTYGRPNRPPRPWLGLYAQEVEDAIIVAGLAERGPAERPDCGRVDRILSVREDR